MKIICIFILTIAAVCQLVSQQEPPPDALKAREKLRKRIAEIESEKTNCPICIEYRKHIKEKHPHWLIDTNKNKTNQLNFQLLSKTNAINKK